MPYVAGFYQGQDDSAQRQVMTVTSGFVWDRRGSLGGDAGRAVPLMIGRGNNNVEGSVSRFFDEVGGSAVQSFGNPQEGIKCAALNPPFQGRNEIVVQIARLCDNQGALYVAVLEKEPPS